MSHIGENIRRLREERGLTQEDIHRSTGIAAAYLSSIENGTRNAGKKTIKKLCDVLLVDEQTLRFGERDQHGLDRRHSFQLRRIVEELAPLPESEQTLWLHRILVSKEAHAPNDERHP